MVKLYLLMSFPFGFVGLIILCIAAAMHRSAIRRRRRATVRADARVAEKLIKINRSGPRLSFCYIYEFPVNGILRRAQFSGRKCLKEGDTVSIFYDPGHPETIYIPEAQPRLAIAALYFIGAAWLMGGIMLFIYGMLGIK